MKSNFECISKYFGRCRERNNDDCIGPGFCNIKNYKCYCVQCWHLHPLESEKCKECVEYNLKLDAVEGRYKDYA